MNAAIAQHLNICESAIVRVEEWARVLFVVCRKLGARFVSKKVVTVETKTYTHYEVADEVCDRINKSETIFTAKLWSKKSDETRVYVSYRNKVKVKDCGYVKVCDSGIFRHLTLQAGTIENLYADLKNLSIKQSTPDLVSKDPLTEVVEECWECGAQYTSYGNVEAGNMGCTRCN